MKAMVLTALCNLKQLDIGKIRGAKVLKVT
jgi:hypothetical protein